VIPRLTARKPASASSTTLPPSSDEGAGTVRSWRGLPIIGPLERRPSAAALSAASEEEEPASDAPCRTSFEAETSKHPPGPLPPPLHQKERFSRSEAPSIDECSLGVRFRENLQREPATVGRTLPSDLGFRTLFRPSLQGGRARLRRIHRLFARGRTCHAPLVDFCNRNVPQARPRFDETPLRPRTHPAFAEQSRFEKGSPLLSEPRSRVVTGQGPVFRCSAHAFTIRHLVVRLRAPRASPQPDRLGHLLS
jgi:hypothetical protein